MSQENSKEEDNIRNFVKQQSKVAPSGATKPVGKSFDQNKNNPNQAGGGPKKNELADSKGKKNVPRLNSRLSSGHIGAEDQPVVINNSMVEKTQKNTKKSEVVKVDCDAETPKKKHNNQQDFNFSAMTSRRELINDENNAQTVINTEESIIKGKEDSKGKAAMLRSKDRLKTMRPVFKAVSNIHKFVNFLKEVGTKIKKTFSTTNSLAPKKQGSNDEYDQEMIDFEKNKEFRDKSEQELKLKVSLVDFVKLWLPINQDKRELFNKVI